MDGKTFVEKFTRILEKVSRMTKNCYDDLMIVSDDPDCDADYGVDANGNLVIDGYRTNLKLSELCAIRYRAKEGWLDNHGEGYISLVFQNDMVFYLYFDWDRDLGDELYALKTNCYYLYNDVLIKNIIQAKDYDWKTPFVISDHKLIAYMGSEKEVIVPEGITEIGEIAFRGNKTTDKVILPTTVQKIGDGAFYDCSLKEIDLAKVEVIENAAFATSSIEHIILPETVKHIGNNALYHTNITSEQDIENHSDVAIDERIFALRK